MTTATKQEFKKIAVLSLGGGVGKTLLVNQVLHPQMPGAKFISIDQVNKTSKHFGIQSEAYTCNDVQKIYKRLIQDKNDLVIDLAGSLECKLFLDGLDEIGGSDELTHIIIPARVDMKESAIQTLDRLVVDQVPLSKVKVVFTAVKKNVAEECEDVINHMIKLKMKPDLDLNLAYSDFFFDATNHHFLLSEFLNDKTDYKMLEANKKDGDTKDYLSRLIWQRQAQKVWPGVNALFNNLFGVK